MKLGKMAACAAAFSLAAGAAQAELSDGVVKIGVLNDQSGLYTDLAGPGSVAAARMAVEDFGGTVNGKAIEILSADHQNKPDVGSNIVREWIDVEGVDVVVDVPTSSVALAVQQVTSEKDTAFLVNGAATTRLTNEDCAATGVHYTYDTYSLAIGTGKAIVEGGGDSWFFITADYAFGHSLEEDTSKVIEENGGEVLGAVRHPLSSSDFSSYLLQAQGSGAKVIGLANAGSDTTNAIKQANEFGIVQSGQSLAALLMFITDVDALGLDVAKGLKLTTGFYWDMDDQTREWSKRYMARMDNKIPAMPHAGAYSSTLHYLKAVKAAGTDESDAVMAKMKEMPVEDFFSRNGYLRQDGRMVHDMLQVRIKKQDERASSDDIFAIEKVIKGDDAFLPLSKGGCEFALAKQ